MGIICLSFGSDLDGKGMNIFKNNVCFLLS